MIWVWDGWNETQKNIGDFVYDYSPSDKHGEVKNGCIWKVTTFFFRHPFSTEPWVSKDEYLPRKVYCRIFFSAHQELPGNWTPKNGRKTYFASPPNLSENYRRNINFPRRHSRYFLHRVHGTLIGARREFVLSWQNQKPAINGVVTPIK